MSAATELLERGQAAALLGEIPGLTRVELAGRGTLPGTQWCEIASTGRAYPWLTAAQGLEVRSTSLQDLPAGTGANAVRITGCTADFVEVTEDVTLNGQTAVPTVRTDWWRVWGFEVLGTKANVGTVNCRRLAPSTTDVLAQIPPSDGRRAGSTLSVPKGRRLLLYGWRYTSPLATVLTRFRFRVDGGPWVLPSGTIESRPAFAGRLVSLPVAYPEKSDLEWSGFIAGIHNWEMFGFMEVL